MTRCNEQRIEGSTCEVENAKAETSEVHIRTIAGTSFAVTMDDDSTVDDLRTAVSSRLGVQVEQLKLTRVVRSPTDDCLIFSSGCEPTERQLRDTGDSMHFVTEYEFKVSGYVARWELYSWGVRTVQLQVWRPADELEYSLVGQISAKISKGYNDLSMETHDEILVQPGDVVGWFMDGVQSIAFDNTGSAVVRRVYGTQGKEIALNMSSHAAGWFRAYSLRATVRPICNEMVPIVVDNSAAVAMLTNDTLQAVVLPRLFGYKPIFRKSVDTGCSMHFVSEYEFDVVGHLIRWELYSNGPRIVKLQVWRPSGRFCYDLVGEVTAPIHEGYNSVELDSENEVLVNPGDVIGWFMERVQAIPFESTSHGPKVRRVYGTGGAATTLDMSDHSLGWFRRYSLQAVVVPEKQNSSPASRSLVENTNLDHAQIV